MKDIIKQVKARRREPGVTLRDVAELSGIGINALSRFEQGAGWNVVQERVCDVGCAGVVPDGAAEAEAGMNRDREDFGL